MSKSLIFMVPQPGLEPGTYALRMRGAVDAEGEIGRLSSELSCFGLGLLPKHAILRTGGPTH